MKTCLIKQPAGIGDILFCQGIIKHYTNKGYRVIYPLRSNLLYLKDYLIEDNVHYCSIDEDFEYKQVYDSDISLYHDDFVFINLDTSFKYVVNDGIMPSKYQLLNLDPTEWIANLKITRNRQRENWLYYDYLGLKDDEAFVVVNNKFGTPPNYREFPIPEINTTDKIVNMNFIENTTIMDWILVLEKAGGIVTVDTCIQYILEKLDINYNFFYCYTRDGSKDHIKKFGLDKIFTIKWDYLV
jgi:hypothetical protein